MAQTARAAADGTRIGDQQLRATDTGTTGAADAARARGRAGCIAIAAVATRTALTAGDNARCIVGDRGVAPTDTRTAGATGAAGHRRSSRGIVPGLATKAAVAAIDRAIIDDLEVIAADTRTPDTRHTRDTTCAIAACRAATRRGAATAATAAVATVATSATGDSACRFVRHVEIAARHAGTTGAAHTGHATRTAVARRRAAAGVAAAARRARGACRTTGAAKNETAVVQAELGTAHADAAVTAIAADTSVTAGLTRIGRTVGAVTTLTAATAVATGNDASIAQGETGTRDAVIARAARTTGVAVASRSLARVRDPAATTTAIATGTTTDKAHVGQAETRATHASAAHTAGAAATAGRRRTRPVFPSTTRAALPPNDLTVVGQHKTATADRCAAHYAVAASTAVLERRATRRATGAGHGHAGTGTANHQRGAAGQGDATGEVAATAVQVELARFDHGRATDGGCTVENQRAVVVLDQAVSALQHIVDRGDIAGASRGAITYVYDRCVALGIGDQRQRIAVHDVAIGHELQAGSGYRTSTVVDADRARGATEDREARLWDHRRRYVAIDVGPV